MENPVKEPDAKINFSLKWDENFSVQDLLDVIVSILSEEYIQKAKENPEIFSE